jgi:pyruvate/2-oxoglutarate/acetoin dehydrogenase E1 component
MTQAANTTTYRDAIREALRDALAADDRVFLMGEDVARYGGAFACSKGLAQEFGEDRIRDTPLSESGFTGAGIGAALGGMRPIVEIMTVNFSLLALDQIVNTAATLRHMSGGQFSVPVVIRIATGASKQLAAQHSHSFDGWYAHVPGLKVFAIGTVEDARGILKAALADPDPVIILEPTILYGQEGPAGDPDTVTLSGAKIRRPGTHISLISWAGSLPRVMEAAETLAADGIDCEVVDVRSLRPLDDATIMASVTKTRRALIVSEEWRSGSLTAEISARIMEQAFYELDAPVDRLCTVEAPMPYAKHLEEYALPQAKTVALKVKEMLGKT